MRFGVKFKNKKQVSQIYYCHIVYCRRDRSDDNTITQENIFEKMDDYMNELERTFVKKAKALAQEGT